MNTARCVPLMAGVASRFFPMIGLLAFLLCAALLVGGYALYGRLAERLYGGCSSMAMPCHTLSDGIDYVCMPTWKIFLIQLLNIAGLGPVFGALSGCLFGPVALLWIVLGCILVGAMHDFLAARMSAEHGGANLPQLIGAYLGGGARYAMRILCVGLLLMVGVVFTSGPAGMLQAMTSSWVNGELSMLATLQPEPHILVLQHILAFFQSGIGWGILILAYYLLATVLPINAIIGKIYPVFGAIFLFMAVGLAVMLPLSGHELLPDLDIFRNMHPKGGAVWPMIFVTIACGAISGFHATQSPMMVRCLGEARLIRPVFYGAMITEGLVALIWATVGLTLRDVATDYALVGGAPTLAQGAQVARASFMELSLASPAIAVNQACTMLLGHTGAVLAVLGVVILPITSGDTAMRSCRLMLADATGLSQSSVRNRLLIALPLFGAVILISRLDFPVIWRYFGWANQTLACFTLWSIAVCLRRKGRWHWLATLPALFMTTMCTTYLLSAPECGILLPTALSTGIGIAVAALACGLCFCRRKAGCAKSP